MCAVPSVPSTAAAALADAQLSAGNAAAQARAAAVGVADASVAARVAAAAASGVAADAFLAGFDDGAAPAPEPGTTPVDWSALRVSFLDVEWRGSSGGVDAAAAAEGGVWALSRAEDELVAVVCEWAAAMRGQAVLAESVWAEALDVGLRQLAEEKGEVAATAGVPAPAAQTPLRPPVAAPSVALGPIAPTATLEDALGMLDGMAPPPPAAALVQAATASSTDASFAALAAAYGDDDGADAAPRPAPGASPTCAAAATGAPPPAATERFSVSPDAVAAACAVYRRAAEARLNRVVLPYEQAREWGVQRACEAP